MSERRNFLGRYEHPRPFPAQRNPYPWLVAERGDWFLAYGLAGAEAIRNSVSAGAAGATKRYEWAPKFRTRKLSEHVLLVERVA